jgi:hypothetical protein
MTGACKKVGTEEKEFTFEFDMKDIEPVLVKFDERNWTNLSDDERLEAVGELTVKIAGGLGLRSVPEIAYFEDHPSDRGMYYRGTDTLGINVCELQKPKGLVNTIAHELRHAYQRQRAENPETEMDQKYLANWQNYVSPMFDQNGELILVTENREQLVEAEARAFADLFLFTA